VTEIWGVIDIRPCVIYWLRMSVPDILCTYEVIGDAAVISVPPGMEERQGSIAQAILSKHKKVHKVLKKTSMVVGESRVPRLELISGEDTVTCYREFGFRYRFDITKVFFNGRLGTERRRIAGLTAPGENVLIPFCGAGPFAIPIAAKGCRVVAVEKNADACRWLALNAGSNGVEKKVDIINGDAFMIRSMLRPVFDRAVIPAPYGRDDALEAILPAVKNGGTLHFYTFKKKNQIKGLIEGYEKMGLPVEGYRRCGNVAPGVSRWAFDLKKAGHSSL
jgi:tRNA (guanine37-N1)-methyltransferase